MKTPYQLMNAIGRQSKRTASPAVSVLIDEIRARHGEAARGVLFYGSCLRSGDDLDGLVDLYVLVDGYRAAYESRMQAFLNALLPPNVYYLEREYHGQVVRTKYAVLSLADFQKGTSRHWFHSYLWGRFCQPTALLYACNDETAHFILNCFAQSVQTFIRRVLPRLPHEFVARQLWGRGLALSYGSELRSEKPQKRARLFDAAPDYYEEITRMAIQTVGYPVEIDDSAGTPRYRARIPRRVRAANRLAWGLRAFQGKLLSVFRLLKAATTFEGGVDYILWKIERHSGVSVEVAPRLKRRPLLAMGVLAWRLYRKGGFR